MSVMRVQIPLDAKALETLVARARLEKWLDGQVSPFARRCRSQALLTYSPRLLPSLHNRSALFGLPSRNTFQDRTPARPLASVGR